MADDNHSLFKGDSIRALLISTAAPVFFTVLATALIGGSDMILSGKISKAAQAAVGIGDQFLFFIALLTTGLTAGVAACISRSLGAGAYRLAAQYARDSLILSAIFGALAAAAGFVLAPYLVQFFSSDEQVIAAGTGYLKLCSLANLPWAIVQAQTAILRCAGGAKSTVVLWSVISFISIVGPMPWFFLPALTPSLEALAIAWDLGASLGVVLGFFLLRKLQPTIQVLAESQTQNNFSGTHLGIRRRACNLLGIGIPVAMGEFFWLVSNFLTYKLLSAMPDPATLQAAWSIKFKIEEMAALAPLLAVSLTAATVVGHKLGADDAAAARAFAKQLTAVATFFMVAIGALLCLAAPLVATIFSSDSDVASALTWMLRGTPILLPAVALPLVLFSAMEGAGFTKVPMICTAAALTLIRLPLVVWLGTSLGFGLAGVWSASLLSHLFLAASAIAIFASAKWDRTGPPTQPLRFNPAFDTTAGGGAGFQPASSNLA